MPDLDVVVVSYRTRSLLRECLDSLRAASLDGCTTVVDNGSDDGSADMVREEFSAVNVVALAENRGFAHAVNRGTAEGRAPHVLVLNADTRVAGEGVPALVSALEADEELAVVGPKLVYPDGRPQESRQPFPTIRGWVASLLRRGGPRPGAVPAGGWYLMGAALLFRRRALEDVGPLDDRYFFYLEEVDWFARARDRGWRWDLVPDTRVVHHLGASMRAADPQLQARVKRNLYRSRLRYFRRHEGGLRTGLLRLVLAPLLLLNLVRHALRRGPGSAAAWLASRILADTVVGRAERL